MKKQMMKSILFLLLIIMIFLSSCVVNNVPPDFDPEIWNSIVNEGKTVKAKVVEITSDTETIESESNQSVKTTLFSARITKGALKGQIINCRLIVYSFMGYEVVTPKRGDSVFLQPIIDENEEPFGEFADYDRSASIIILLVLFAFVVILVGGKKGVLSLVALILTCLGIAFIFIPSILNNSSPITSSIFVGVLVSAVTFLLIGGFHTKTFSALLGVFFGLCISGALVAVMQVLMKLTGLIDNEAIRLSQLPGLENLNMNGLMFAAVLIGALGAAMDVSMSIATSLEELHKTGMTGVPLIRSGMKIGRDIMGTMTNTLVLAYIGGALHLVLILATDLSQFAYIISWELITTEILRALAGSIGLVVIVPATSVLSALFYHRPNIEDNPFA